MSYPLLSADVMEGTDSFTGQNIMALDKYGLGLHMHSFFQTVRETLISISYGCNLPKSVMRYLLLSTSRGRNAGTLLASGPLLWSAENVIIDHDSLPESNISTFLDCAFSLRSRESRGVFIRVAQLSSISPLTMPHSEHKHRISLLPLSFHLW